MDSYPDEYVTHNLPFVLLSGLEQEASTESIASDHTRTYLGEGGFRIRAELPPVQGSIAEELLNTLLSYDSTKAPWHSQTPEKGVVKQALKVRSVGRVGQLFTSVLPSVTFFANPARHTRCLREKRLLRLMLHDLLLQMTTFPPLRHSCYIRLYPH